MFKSSSSLSIKQLWLLGGLKTPKNVQGFNGSFASAQRYKASALNLAEKLDETKANNLDSTFIPTATTTTPAPSTTTTSNNVSLSSATEPSLDLRKKFGHTGKLLQDKIKTEVCIPHTHIYIFCILTLTFYFTFSFTKICCYQVNV